MVLDRLALTILALLASATAQAELDSEQCQQALTEVSPQLQCALEFTLSETEQADLLRETSGVLRDLACVAQVAVSKAEVLGRLVGSGALALPAQPIACRVSTNMDAFDLGFTVAPVIEFAGFRAQAAAVNLAAITGLPPFLARLIEQFVNESPAVETAIVDAVNRFLDGI